MASDALDPWASPSAGRDAGPADAELVITPLRGWIGLDWRELWRYRELLYFLVWRDVKVRYKQTVLGACWAVLQPVSHMIVFTVIFGRVAGLDSEDLPYAVFVYAGLLPWTFFASSVTAAGQSLVNQQQLLTKTYFPRLFVPTATLGSNLVDLIISFGVYAALVAGYHLLHPSWSYAPGARLLLLPGLVALTLVFTLGLGYLLAALTVTYRDFRFVIPFLVQSLLFLSPVIYSTSAVPEPYRWLLALNPMAGIIDGFRAAILGRELDVPALAASLLIAGSLLVLGTLVFRRTERHFADVA